MVAWAFNSKVNPMGVKLKAMMSSDIGHWDVTDMNEVVEEVHELVDDGLITKEEFCDYTFTNAAMLYAGMNPDFFKGTGFARPQWRNCCRALRRLQSKRFRRDVSRNNKINGLTLNLTRIQIYTLARGIHHAA
jgi:hypothetical protein